jgi:hypothetical protein
MQVERATISNIQPEALQALCLDQRSPGPSRIQPATVNIFGQSAKIHTRHFGIESVPSTHKLGLNAKLDFFRIFETKTTIMFKLYFQTEVYILDLQLDKFWHL